MADEKFDLHGWMNQDQQPTEPVSAKPYEVSGVAEPLIGGLGAGLAGLPKQLITDPLRALGILDTPTQQQLQQAPAEPQPQFSGTLPKWLYQAAEMLPASFAPTLAGAGTGALIGGIPGAVVGGVAGGLGGAGLFGLSQAQSTKEQAIRQGVDPGMAPLLTGLTEGGLEALSNLVLGGVAGKLIKEPLRQTGKALLAPIAKNVAQLGIGEVLPEMAQAGIQAGIEKGYGIRPEADPLQEALSVIGPTAIMSLMGGAGMSAASKLLPGAEKTMPPGYGEQALGTAAPEFSQPTVAEPAPVEPELDLGYPVPPGMVEAREEARTPWGGTVVLPKEPQEPDAKSIVLPSENVVPPSSKPAPFTIKEAMTEGKPVENVSVDMKTGQRVGETLPKPKKGKVTPDVNPVMEEDPNGDIRIVARTLEELIKQTKGNQETINNLQSRLAQGETQPSAIPGMETLPAGGGIGFIKQTPTSTPQPAPKAAPVVEKAKPSTEKMTSRGFPVALQNTKTGELISGGGVHGNLLAERNIDPEDVGKGKTWASGFVDPATNEFMSRQKALKRLVDMDKADKRAKVAAENAANTPQAPPAENAAALESVTPKPAKKIIGYSESGEELTPDNFKDVLAREAATKLSEAAKGGRLSGITVATQQTYGNSHPNVRIVREVGKSLGNSDTATVQVTKGSPIFLDVAQKFKALGQNKTGVDSKQSVIQISPDRKTRNITYNGNSIEISRDDTIDPNTYNVTVRTTAPVAETVAPTAPEVAKLVDVAAKKVVKQNTYQPEANKEHVHSPNFAASEKAQDRNARSSNLSGLGNISEGPAVAINGNMVHTPAASYRIEKRGITQVKNNTPEEWARIVNKYPPDSKGSNITTNRQYREEHVVMVGNKPTKQTVVKPESRTEKRATAPKPTPKSEAKKPTAERKVNAAKSAMSDLDAQAEWVEAKKRQARVKEGTSSEPKVEEKPVEQEEKKFFDSKSIKFDGRTIKTDKVVVTFPKDVVRGSISIKTNGMEVASILGTELSNPEKVAKLITQKIGQQHDGVNFEEVKNLILKEMTGEKESVSKAEGTTKAEETKEVKEEKVTTKALYVEKRFSRQLTLEEYASIIPKEGLGTKVLFLNHFKRAMGLDSYPAGWDRFYQKHAKQLGDLYSTETSKRPRLVQQAITDIKSGRDIKSNWLGRVVDTLTSTNPKQAIEYTKQTKYPSPGDQIVKKMSTAWFVKHGKDPKIEYDSSLTPEQKVMLEMFGRLFKKEVIPYKGNDNLSGVSFDGRIFINSKLVKAQNGMDRSFHTTMAHEFVHQLKRDYPHLWDKLKTLVIINPAFEKAFKGIKNYVGNDNTEAIDELVSDAASQFFLDKKFWDQIAREQPTVFEKLVGIVKDFIRSVMQNLKFMTQFGDQAVRDLYGDMIRKGARDFESVVSTVMAEYSRNRNNMFKTVEPMYDKRVSALSLSKVLPHSSKTWFRKSVLTENGRPRTLFHGSIKEIGTFNTNRTEGSIDQRLGAHFAFDPKLADQFSFGEYTNFSRATNKDNLLFDETDNGYHLPGGRVYPVVIRAENPLDLSDSKYEDWKQIQFDAYKRLFAIGHKKQLFMDTYSTLLGMNPTALNQAWNHMMRTGGWTKFFDEYNLPHLQEIDPSSKSMVDVASRLASSYKTALRAAGYDSVIYKHTDQSVKLSDPRSIIVFDSDQAKSMYDTNPDGEIPKGLWIGGSLLNRNVNDIALPVSISPVAEEEFNKSRGLGTISGWEKFKQYGKDAVKDFTRQFVHLDPEKWGDIANTLYKFKYSGEYGQKIAIDKLRDVVRGLTPNRYNLFRRMIIMPDLINYIHNAQSNPKLAGKPIMGYNNAVEAQQDYARFKQAANADSLVTAALARRKQMMTEWRRLMVASKILPEHVLDARREDYFRHQVLDWMGAKALGEDPTLMLGSQGESVRLRKAGWQRARKGTIHSYNTEYLEAEYEVLAQGYHQLEAKGALDHLKSYDKWKEFHDEWKLQSTQPGGESDFKLFVKAKGYDFWQPRKGNFLHKAWTLTDKALDRVMAEQRDEFTDPVTGETRPTQDLNESTRGLNRETVQGMPLPTWVLPDPVVKQLNQLEPPADDSVLAKATAKTLGWWKQWVLFNPLRLTKYVFNNTSGDLDIALAYDPKILKFAKQSAIDLWKYTQDPGSLSPTLRAEMENALRQRVIDAGITFEEIGGIGSLTSSDIFKYLDNTNQNLWEKHKGDIGNYMKFVKKWANYRENILRLAAYRYFQQRVASGQPVYAASKKEEIDSINNADDKAAKLARELIGDYGNISRAGQWMRKHMIPFWSWLEINAPRYIRILHNTRYEGEITGNVGARAALVGTKKVALTTAKAAALFAAINLFNRAVFPDEDDELRKTGRGQLHLILGRREDGTIRTLRIQGALSDALSWLGLENFGGDFKDLVSGKKDLLKQLKETAIAPVQRIVLGTRPIERTLSEMALGKTMWPDLTNPRPIRDPYEHFFKSISMDLPYRYTVGKPVRGLGNDAENLLFYKADTGEAAYYKVMQKAREFLKDNNVELPSASPTKRSNALYYYKQAKKFGDKDAEVYWLEQFKEQGGKLQNVLQSIKKAHPMAFMPVKFRGSFMSGLDQQDKDLYNMAVNWWHKTYLSK